MAVTILERPEGHILSGTSIDVTASDSGGDVLFTAASNPGRLNGDIIYLDTNVEDYNGFYKIANVSPTTFTIQYISTSDDVLFISETTGVYYANQLTHGWSCVHLPITHRISSDLYPTNSVDADRTILTLSDDLGYARVTLSGSLGTFEDLSFVKISNAANSDFDGVYQIFDKISTTDITLSVAYSTFNGAGLLGATIQLYYGNYNVVVHVYAGINASHEWTSQKPYELAATLELIPDSNNEVTFSINEILKAYVKSVNNLLLGTMPNNIDAWTNFYISIAEQYDTSNGYTVSTNLSSFTSDQSTFEGTAVNAVLPFKNIHSGNLSEYLMTNSAAKFLTLFSIPVLFQCGYDTPNCYQDISWINPDKSSILATTFRKQYYLNGVFQTTVSDSIAEDSGVIRTEIEADCDYDRVDVTILGGEQLIDEPLFNATGDWQQTVTVPGAAWTISGGMASVIIVPAGSSEYLYQSRSGTAQVYRVICNVSTTDGGAPDNDWQATVFAVFFTGGTGGTEVLAQSLGTVQGTAVGNNPTLDIDTQFTVPGSFDTIAIFVGGFGGVVDTVTVHIEDFYVAEVATQISETKQFDVDCGCADQEMRLTWLNYIGGFDYWVFKAETGHAIDIISTKETTKNIFPEWPKSYGEFSDTIRKQTSRESVNRIFLTTQYLTEDQADALAYIKTSPLVQIVNSRSDRRTIIVDSDSFTKYTDNQKLITISFNARYTDNIGSQKV